MADLVISASSPGGGARVLVTVQLCDANRRPVSAFDSGSSMLVTTFQSRTDDSGDLTIDIPANDDLDVADTFYEVVVGEFTRLIQKTSSSQTLEEASVTDLEILATKPHSFIGEGSPEGVVRAPVSSEYHQTDGTPGAVLWLKDTGTGNTGWVVAGSGGGGGSGTVESVTDDGGRVTVDNSDPDNPVIDNTALDLALTNLAAAAVNDGDAAGGSLAGTYPNPSLAANSVGSPEIAANAVGSSELADNAVDTAAIQDDAVTAAKIATDAVGSAEIAADAVGSSEIAANAVTSSELADNAVDTAAIQDDAVTAAKIAADAVGSSEIAADAVGSSEIAANAVTSSELADNAVDTAAIQDDAVTAAKIATDAVGTAEIAANAVGSSELADNAVDTAAIQDDAVTAAKIAADAVGSSEIAANAVGSSELADNAVDTAAIQDASITAAKFDPSVSVPAREAGAQYAGIDPNLTHINSDLNSAARSGTQLYAVQLADSIQAVGPELTQYKKTAAFANSINGKRVIFGFQSANLGTKTGCSAYTNTFKENGVQYTASAQSLSAGTYTCDGIKVMVQKGTAHLKVWTGSVGGTLQLDIDCSALSHNNHCNWVDVPFGGGYGTYAIFFECTSLTGTLIQPGWQPTYGNMTQGYMLISGAVPGDTSSEYATLSVSDAVFNSTTTVTSATANFETSIVGADITGAGIPANTTVAAWVSATQITLSAATSTTGSGKSITWSKTWKGQDLIANLVADGKKVHGIAATGFNDLTDPSTQYGKMIQDMRVNLVAGTSDIMCVAPWWNSSGSGNTTLVQDDKLRTVAEANSCAFLSHGVMFGEISGTFGTSVGDPFDFAVDGAHPDPHAASLIGLSMSASFTGNTIGDLYALTKELQGFVLSDYDNGKIALNLDNAISGGTWIGIWDKATEANPTFLAFGEPYADTLGLAANGGGWGVGPGAGTAISEHFWFHAAGITRTDSAIVNPNTFVRKTATETVNNGGSGATLQNDDELLLALPGVSGATFLVEAVIKYDGVTTGDISAAFTVPSGATIDGAILGPLISASGTSSNNIQQPIVASADRCDFGAIGTGAGNRMFLRAFLIIVMSTTAGNLQLQWCQRVADATNTSVFANSYLKMQRVA